MSQKNSRNVCALLELPGHDDLDPLGCGANRVSIVDPIGPAPQRVQVPIIRYVPITTIPYAKTPQQTYVWVSKNQGPHIHPKQ